jgi:hypothetical protein
MVNKETRTLYLTLGIITGVMGIVHGLGEVLQGNQPSESVFIQSRPNSPFFAVMNGEPAITIVPNYLITGLLAIVFSCAFLVMITKPIHNKTSRIILVMLLSAMLLTGAGFGSPVLGLVAVLITIRSSWSQRFWDRIPVNYRCFFSALWPFPFALCLPAWVFLFPGASILDYFMGINSPLLMILPLIVSFATISITLVLGYARDIS